MGERGSGGKVRGNFLGCSGILGGGPQGPSWLLEEGEVTVFEWGFPGRTVGLWRYGICREMREREAQGQGH